MLNSNSIYTFSISFTVITQGFISSTDQQALKWYEIRGINKILSYDVGFCWYAQVAPLVPVGRGCAKQYKVLLTVPYDETFFIMMGVVSSRMTPPTSTRHKDSLNGLTRMKRILIVCYGLQTDQIPATQQNTIGSDVLDIALHHHQQNTN